MVTVSLAGRTGRGICHWVRRRCAMGKKKGLRDCLGTLFRNSLTVGSLKKINNLFIKDIFHRYCLKRQSLRCFLPAVRVHHV